MVKTRSESFRTLLEDLTKEFLQPDLNERALILADIVSYEIWGGARGWERATDEQFAILVGTLKEKLRENQENTPTVLESLRRMQKASRGIEEEDASTDECESPVRREG